MVDKMPEPPFDVSQYLAKNIKYPEAARKKKIEGRVTVRFTVDKDGNIVNANILRSPDEMLAKEALSVVSQMPKWQPGEQNGKKVAVYFTLPIVFKLG